MSDIILVEPTAPFDAANDVEVDEWPSVGFIDYPAPPHSRIALYEWIRLYAESQRPTLRTHESVTNLIETESALRALISMDEGCMRTNRLARGHVAALVADVCRRESAVRRNEVLVTYQLHRLLRWERRIRGDLVKTSGTSSASHNSTPVEMEATLLSELRTRLEGADASGYRSALTARRLAEDRLAATTRVLEQQNSRLEGAQAELHEVCRAINALAESMGVSTRCQDSRSTALAALQSEDNHLCTPMETMTALRHALEVYSSRRAEVLGVGERGTCVECEHLRREVTRLRSELQECQMQRQQPTQGWEPNGQSKGSIPHSVSLSTPWTSCQTLMSSENGTGFDPFTVALKRLEESRTHCFALERELSRLKNGRKRTLARNPPEMHRTVSRNTDGRYDHDSSYGTENTEEEEEEEEEDTFGNTNHIGSEVHETESVATLSLESRRYEEHLTVRQELRQLFSMLYPLEGVRTAFLRLCNETGAVQYAAKPFALFAAHGVSLHQWVTRSSARPVRYAAVLYALPPTREGELPREQLEKTLMACSRNTQPSRPPLILVDLRGNSASGGGVLSGEAIRFSSAGEFMYVCVGSRRTAVQQAVGQLQSALKILPLHCFLYSDANAGSSSTDSGAFRQTHRLGWVGYGICAWALDDMVFESPAERERFLTHLNDAYRVVLHLSRAEVHALAGDCVEIVCRSIHHTNVTRRLLISLRAFHALSAENRRKLMAWYGPNGCLVPDLSLTESLGGYSVGSVVLTVVTHGAEVPPPSACGFLAFSGIGRKE